MTSVFYVEVDTPTENATSIMDIARKAIQIVEGNANMDAQRNPWNETIIFTCDLPFVAGAGEVETTDYAFDFVFDQVYEQLNEKD